MAPCQCRVCSHPPMSWPRCTAYDLVCKTLRQKQAMHAQQVADEAILRLIVRKLVEYFYSDFRQTSPRVISLLGSSAVAPVNVVPVCPGAIDDLKTDYKVPVMIRGLKGWSHLNGKYAETQYFDGRKAQWCVNVHGEAHFVRPENVELQDLAEIPATAWYGTGHGGNYEICA